MHVHCTLVNKKKTYVEEIQLKDMDFLLDILLCVKPSLNQTALQLFHFVRSWISPTMTNTYVEEVQLKDMDFPL